MSNITDQILDIIKSKNIAPRPRWHFALQQVMIWVMTFISIVIGSISFSLIIFNVVNNEWEVLKFIDRSLVSHSLNTLPYLWIFILLVFLALAYYNAKNSKGAYKYHAYWLVIASVFLSIIIGGIFYAVGIAPRINFEAKKIPILQKLIHDREAFWMDEDNGLIAGEITKMLSGGGMFEIKDLDNSTWVIIPGEDYFPPPPDFVIDEGVMIRIYGEKIDDNIFEAERIMPYQMGPGTRHGGMLNRLPGGAGRSRIDL